jgi:PadR family transcriptional regulator AphA
MAKRSDRSLLLGEWACLGILYAAPAHGFAVAARLKPDGDIGRVWSLSRALTYRSIDQLRALDLVAAVAQEPGIAGGQRTILAVTATGRRRFRAWVRTPVAHLRDLRSELLLKLLLAEACHIDITGMLVKQRAAVEGIASALDGSADGRASDVVARWRRATAHAALSFLEEVAP